MFDSILVVCIGNICRSPTAERLFKRGLPNKKIASAGLQAMKKSPADDMANRIASEHNLSLDGHSAKQLNAAMCKEYSLILVMEKTHIEAVCNIAPEVRGKTMLLGHWLNQQEITDPYHKSKEAFEYVYRLIDESVQRWINILNR